MTKEQIKHKLRALGYKDMMPMNISKIAESLAEEPPKEQEPTKMFKDEIYEGESKETIIDFIYSFHLQNTSGRETPNEMFKLGIEAVINELNLE